MASLSEMCAELLGLSEPSARFLLALYSAHPLALLYRLVVVRSSSTVQNLYFTLSGALVFYYLFGTLIWHSAVDILLVYSVLWWCGGTLLSVQLTWIIAMGHLLIGYVMAFYAHEIHSVGWTIPHCVLTLKLIGLSYNLYDGKKDPDKLSKELKGLAIKKLPSFTDVTGFCYFYGSVLVGPQIPFSRHLKFTEGRLFDWDKTPSSIPAGLQRLLLGVFFAAVYSILHQYFPISMLVADEYADRPFYMRLLLLVVCGKVAMWRYVAVWLIAEGACILTGISYQEQEGGVVSWHGLDNIHIIKFETCITLQGVIDSFNLNTNKWAAWYVYKRLKFLGSQQASMVITLMFLSIWHGLWPGYHINFSMEILAISAERAFVRLSKRLLGCSSLSEMSVPLRVPLTILAYVYRNLFLMYPLTCFMLLEWADCYKFMSAIYFFQHVLVVGWLALNYAFLGNLFKTKPARQNQNGTKSTKTD